MMSLGSRSASGSFLLSPSTSILWPLSFHSANLITPPFNLDLGCVGEELADMGSSQRNSPYLSLAQRDGTLHSPPPTSSPHPLTFTQCNLYASA